MAFPQKLTYPGLHVAGEDARIQPSDLAAAAASSPVDRNGKADHHYHQRDPHYRRHLEASAGRQNSGFSAAAWCCSHRSSRQRCNDYRRTTQHAIKLGYK